MKVLFLTASYPTPEDPVKGIFVKEHARAAAKHADVAIVHLDRGGGHYGIQEVTGEEFRTLRVRYPRSVLGYFLHFIGAAAAFRRLRRSGFDADVIHAHFFLAALPPLLLRPLFRKPVVVSEQWSVFMPEDPATLSRPMLGVARFALARAARVMPASEALRRSMSALGIRARYEVVPNVVDTEVFHPIETAPHATRRLLFVGMLYDAKGVDYLLRAIALLARRRDDIELEIVGDGPERAEDEALARELGLSEIVSFAGTRSKAEVAQRMRDADAFVFASRYDNNPCALIEALASGLPAVATRVGGIPEILDDGSGLLARPADPEDIAVQLGRLLDDPQRFDRDAISTRAGARYGTKAVGGRLREIYADALHEAARSSEVA